MSDVSPARIGLLFDYIGEDGTYDENMIPSLQLVADDFLARGMLERPVEYVIRHVQGLPNGSFRAVRDAFFELVEEDALVIFGPWVSENGVALRPVRGRARRGRRASPWAAPSRCSASGCSASRRDRWRRSRSSWPPWPSSTAAAPSASRTRTR